MKPFTLAIVVAPADIDGQGHVNNVVYLRWMQEAATAHWDAKATAELKARVTWVVTRHEVDYKAPAFAGERLVARTWVGQPSGATWERFIEIRRVADDRLLARGRSLYAALDPATGRPRRVDAGLRKPLEDPGEP
jgi:acyl-CoA thioester hydrolase